MEQYRTAEFSFTGTAPEGSQVKVGVQGIFRSSKGTETTVKGFYAGSGVYKVRFLPEEAGEYTYEISGIPGNNSGADLKGSFVAESCASVGSVDHGHGIVRADGTHFRYADGNWFYPFGTTVYALAHQTDELINTTIDTLAHSPFNKVRMCVFPKHYHYNHNEPKYYPFEKKADGSWDVDHPCFAFWDAFEAILHRLEELDIQVDLILFHPYDRWGFATLPQQDNLTYLDYLLRRFAALPNLWWSLANEYDLCTAKTMEDWYEIEDFVADNDPFHHLESCHNCMGYYDAKRPHITHESLQIKTLNFLDREIAANGKPVSVDECCYEGNIEESWGNISGKEMTNRFWEAIAQGSYCTHGETFLDRSVDPDDAVLWWAKGGRLHGQSPERIAFLKAIVEALPGPMEACGADKMAQLATMPEAVFLQLLEKVPEEYRVFARNIYYMDPLQRERGDIGDHRYYSHVGNDAFLFYYGSQCLCRARIELPADTKYKVEAIDTWNMTREILVEDVSGTFYVTLPGHEGMAVLATKMKEEVR